MIDADLEKLIVIYEEKNLSNAATRIGISQSALSKSLFRLEERIDKSLFTRTNRGLIATSSCEQLFRFAKEQQLSWKALAGKIYDNETEQPVGFVRIAAHSILFLGIQDVLARLLDLGPHIQLDLVMSDSVLATQKVLTGQVDLAIVANPIPHHNLVIIKLAREEVCGYQASNWNTVDRVIYNPELIQAPSIIRKIKPRELVPIANYELAASMAHSKNTMAILPKSVAHRHKLKFKGTHPFYIAQIGLVRLKKTEYPQALKKVVSMIKTATFESFD